MEQENQTNKVQLSKALIIIVNVIVIFFAFVALCVTIFNMVYVSTGVEGYSMLPTLNSTQPHGNEEGDIVYINRFIQGKNGDIVVARVDWSTPDILIIKRLIASEGDKVKVDIDNVNNSVKLYVNEVLVRQSEICLFSNQYQNYKNNNPERFDENDNLIIGKNEAYLLGDNWNVSNDCSAHGPISRSCIIGRVDIVIPYQHNVYSSLLSSLFDFFRIK